MQALHYLLPLIFLIGSLKAENVQSIQEGDFFNPLVWSNQEVPDLTNDSIFVNHNLYNYQEITIGNAGYLYISNCVFLCGDFPFTIDSGGYVFIDGTLYTEKFTVYGTLENNGYLSCTYKFTVSAGMYFGCGGGIVRNEVQNCTRKGPIRDTATEFSILNGTLLLEIDICKCTKKIDFGDNTTINYDSGSVTHTYIAAGIYTLVEYTYCPCDTFIVERTIKIDSICDVVSDLVVFPNPGNGAYKLRYTYCKSGTYNVRLCNNIGQLIRNITIQANKELPFDMLGMAPGVYFIVPPTSSGVKPKRFVHF